MKRYVLRRVAGTILAYLVVATIIFFLFRQVGDPLAVYAAADMSPGQLSKIRETFGLGQPVYIQYLKFMRNVLTLQFGISFFYMTEVRPIVLENLLNSLLLTVPSLIIAYVVAILGGVVLAWKKDEPIEDVGLVTAIFFRSAPRFWVGLVLLFVFAGILPWFPSGGILSPGASIKSHYELLLNPDFYRHAILPILSMTLYLIGLPLLLMRTSMLEIIEADFVDILRAKGMTETDVMYKHVARNALLPVITAFAIAIGYSFGGNVLVETVFSYPGVGRLMVSSVLQGDYPMAQAAFLVMAGMVLIMNLIADLAYGVLDPRVKYD